MAVFVHGYVRIGIFIAGAAIAALGSGFGEHAVNPMGTRSHVLYVDDDAPALPHADGRSWKKAYPTLQDALAEARKPGANVSEIRVAGGVYKPDRGAGVVAGDVLARFHLVQGVALRGGYAGWYSDSSTGLTVAALNPNARDFYRYESVISGDLLGNDGPPGSFTNYSDNSIVLMIATGLTGSFIEGVTFVAKESDSSLDPDGGAIVCEGGRMSVALCRFRYNRGGYHGGGVFFRDAVGAVDDCHFLTNSSRFGAGITSYASDVSVTNCKFTDNRAFDYGGAYFAEGISTAVFTHCEFVDNSSQNKGGAVGIRGSGTFSRYRDCVFTSNSVGTGGGAVICRFGDGAEFERCVFRENYASIRAGAVEVGDDLDGQPGIFLDCDFIDNFSSYEGGAAVVGGTHFQRCRFIRNVCGGDNTGAAVRVTELNVAFSECLFNGNDSWGPGGAIQVNSGLSVQVRGCTFANNITLQGGGAISGDALVRNSVFWDNLPDQLSGTFDVAYSCLPISWPGDRNIRGDPNFVNQAGADGTAGNEDDDLRLGAGSPCIDAGNNQMLAIDVFDADLDGDMREFVPIDLFRNSRIAIGRPQLSTMLLSTTAIVDMGAIETFSRPPLK